MKRKSVFLRIATLTILTMIFLTGITGQSWGVTGQSNDIRFTQRLDTVFEQQMSHEGKAREDQSATQISDRNLVTGSINIIKENLNFVSQSLSNLWNSMPNWARGLLKGITVGLIAAAAIVGLAFLGFFGTLAMATGITVAILAGVAYGLVVGGDGFSWSKGLFISIMAGLSAAVLVEVAGTVLLNKIKGLLAYMGEEGWVQSTIRSFSLGGLVNLTSYCFTHDKFTIWGIVGSFLVGGMTGALYGEMMVPWLYEARYLSFLSRYRKLLPLAGFMKGRLGRFLMLNLFGGGIIGALTTIMQNGFIGERTTPTGLAAGIISGFVASTLILSPYSGLSKAIVKQCVKDIAQSGLVEFFRIRLLDGLEKIRERNRKQFKAQKS